MKRALKRAHKKDKAGPSPSDPYDPILRSLGMDHRTIRVFRPWNHVKARFWRPFCPHSLATSPPLITFGHFLAIPPSPFP